MAGLVAHTGAKRAWVAPSARNDHGFYFRLLPFLFPLLAQPAPRAVGCWRGRFV